MPMSTPTRRADPADRRRGGFSLIEILVVLTIFALSTAIIMPSTARMLDQATSHAVFFEFQRQVSEVRREANRTGIGLRVVDPEMASVEPGDDRVIVLRNPWRYTIAPALDIAEGGECATATANLVKEDRVVMTLRTSDGSCQFMRQASVAAQRP